MKTALPPKEIRDEARRRNRRIKELNRKLSHLIGNQDSCVMAAAGKRCACCRKSFDSAAKSYQPDIDALRAEKAEHVAWLNENVPGIVARVLQLKDWMVTNDGIMTTYGRFWLARHPFQLLCVVPGR